VKNTTGKLCRGVDTRGEGGYVISWWCAGYECFDHTPPQPWPDWLFHKLTYQPPAPSIRLIDPDRSIDGIMRRLTGAQEGERNSILYWSACRLTEHGIDADALLPAAQGIGLPAFEARRTIASAKGRAAP
jgi:hypothetical protein